ncbi:MAG: hypothetical protein VW230_03605 [Candidatus Poseidoniales archaeon]|jgi:hypothetical protein
MTEKSGDGKNRDALMRAVFTVMKNRKIHNAAIQSSKNCEKYLEKKGQGLSYSIYLF